MSELPMVDAEDSHESAHPAEMEEEQKVEKIKGHNVIRHVSTNTEDKHMPSVDIARKESSRVRMRKQSLGMSQIQGINKPMDRMSCIALEFKRPPLVFAPTYQIDPLVKFNVLGVTKIVNEVIDEGFSSHIYSDSGSPVLALKLATTILRTVKALHFNRYRILSIVTIAQKRAQSYNNAITFLWDPDRDGYVETHKEVSSAFIQVTVFAIYLD